MEDIKIEIGRHIDKSPNVIYVLQLIKFNDRRFETGIVVKEFVLEKGKSNIFQFNVPDRVHGE